MATYQAITIGGVDYVQQSEPSVEEEAIWVETDGSGNKVETYIGYNSQWVPLKDN